MTAEVVILNRGAVAIAADSAVTLGSPGRKIYNTANKLFPLSTVEPVAVMVYGAGSLCSIPWETVIKEHRRQLAETAFGTVEEYAISLMTYLSALVPHVSKQEQRERVVMTALWELDMVRTAVEGSVKTASGTGNRLTDSRIQTELLNRINTRIQQLQQCGHIEGLSASVAGSAISDAIGQWSRFVDDSLSPLSADSKIKSRARVLVRTSLRAAHPSLWGSGVVVVGFGRDQLFPALTHCYVDGVVANRVRVWRVDDVCIGEDQSAGICPFAQEDMVATFMDGINPAYRLALQGLVDETIGRFTGFFAERVQGSLPADEHAELLDEMDNARTTVVNSFQESLDDYRKEQNSGPIMSIVESLPKEELAEMAETLVNLTSFKRRVTPEAETVGRPIDVAVISKGDGLVWIKRKHYFVPELNPRYFVRDLATRNSGIMELDHDTKH